MASPTEYQGGVYAFLKARKEQRLRELRNCWHAVSLRLAAWQPALEGYYDAEEDTAEKWVAFLRASPAFEALARFFSLCKALLSPHRSPPELLAASPNGVDPTPLLASSDKPSGHQGHDHESDQDQDEPPQNNATDLSWHDDDDHHRRQENHPKDDDDDDAAIAVTTTPTRHYEDHKECRKQEEDAYTCLYASSQSSEPRYSLGPPQQRPHCTSRADDHHLWSTKGPGAEALQAS
ncbi:hypothetical protein M406DRAFT_332044 [Cryphonectria parasitica EP155]|uniref:Uncharacterized protein n=1 Tax=Cryphonectria parasitica (strain ATCC 38755 / EP155) TaxID=660469 RepID=A0A9P4XZD4_CRYP1|nr:uncharacterized protein M406DRAFT_335305 [Cryphonectria parasitica EP155]XP_040774533.1 uncharacterized protein M406DRAFT_332044 [Cryphonectria parasitica EP155]KAF3760110.1 hypothetical protein M406DRAFT_335305 [Cryphonectria parasitica EP155]KAF3763572.1 hypothetical protein M406DRAFT_332044 [Cryphonectria parasitica EP155]